MQPIKARITMKKAILAASILLLTSGPAFAQQQVNLTAAPTSTTLPDGSTIPMWGYFCGGAVANSTATCKALNPSAAVAGNWSPVVITVPTGQGLTISLTNNLSFTATGSNTTNNIPTSLVIVGQLGGGLGQPTTVPSPAHPPQGDATWSTVVAVPSGQAFTPATQGPRVQSFGTEVPAGPPGTATPTTLTWTAPRPGTYLLESGTHPSIQATMGLIGIVVVTQAPGTAAGTAYPVGYLNRNTMPISYSADVPLMLSEIDPGQNRAVQTAVTSQGFNEDATYGLYFNGPIASIAVTNGGSGYTSAPTVNIVGGGGTGAGATAMIDTTPGSPTYGQVTEIDLNIDSQGNTGGTGYTSAPNVTFSGGGGSGAAALASLSLSNNGLGHCQGPGGPLPAPSACYPPVVNYTPLYYLINGVAFSKTNPAASLFPLTPAGATNAPLTGNILVRFVNAGSRMHVPSIVGSTAPNGAVGFQLIAEDGNVLAGADGTNSGLGGQTMSARVQSEVFMAAGKTYDVMIQAPAAGSTALPVFDRELSLSGNSVNRDSGMLAYIAANGAALPSGAGQQTAQANPDIYPALIAGQPLTIADPSKGVIANDVNIYGVKIQTQATSGMVALNTDGTFTYTPNSGSTATNDHFSYCGNGATSGTQCATVALNASAITTSNITLQNTTWNSKVATYIRVPPPGVLTGATDSNGLPLTVTQKSITDAAAMGVILDANGGFTATRTVVFSVTAQNSVGTTSGNVSATVNFPSPSNLAVTVKDPRSGQIITDYRWIIEEDKSFYIDPGCTSNPPLANSTVTGQPCIKTTAGTVPILGVNFHTSDMTYVAQGCTGAVSCESGQTVDGNPAVCDEGNGNCRAATTITYPDGSTGAGKTPTLPSQVGMLSATAGVDSLGQALGSLDPTKHYYISVLPGDAADPFINGNGMADCYNNPTAANCGHGMGGAPIVATCTGASCTPTTFNNPVNVLVEQSPYPTAKLAVNVFEDDFPLNGEQDSGGGVDILATNEPGLGSFNIVLWDDMGGSGDVTGQMTYDMFNQPLSNSLDGTIDPATGLNACPVTQSGTTNPTGITGMITVCPTYESDGATLSPLAGEAVVANLMPGRYSVQAIPGADRIARGEEWLQTNTLDGQKAHDSFLRIGEPAYFQEFGPANYHVNIGFANPAIINKRKASVCNNSNPNLTASDCSYTVTGHVTDERMSRTPDERLYSSGSYDAFAWTQCYVSLGDPDGEDFAFTKCDANGKFTLAGIPQGNWRVTVFDEWNDMIVDGLSTPVGLNVSGAQTTQTCPGPGTTITASTSQTNGSGTCDMGDIATNQWQANVYTKTFIDTNATGVASSDSPGVGLVNTTVRYRDGSLSNNLGTDFNGVANFNETFPLFNWYAVETDTTRYKNSGTHTVYDAGGPADGSGMCGSGGANSYPQCGSSTIGKYLANTYEAIPLPSDLSVPGSVYCANADCTSESISNGPKPSGANSTGRIDNPWLGQVEGWQGFSGQGNFIEFGKMPYADGENGGIHGHVVYASTRPFDDPQLLVQTQWEPLVPNVTMNLYQEGVASDGVTPTLTLVDTTKTTSWDAWAQGFHQGPNGETVPNMNCPGQSPTDLFYFSLENQPQYLDLYNQEHATPDQFNANVAGTPLPYSSQYKCYDGMHNWNQLQPAVYDGMYSFPSVTAYDANGKPNGTNCKACINDPASDMYHGLPMLPAGKYVVEVVPPEGFEIVKEEDKNILIGDNYIAPVSQEFGGLGDIFILPDQASVASSLDGTPNSNTGAGYNSYNASNPTTSMGATPNNGEVPGFAPEPVWPCVGESRVVPDYISLFPQSQQVAPFAGATRNLCDRKEVTLNSQMGAIAKFYLYTSTHKAAKFTGVITDDFTSEFDPFSPQFGEKFAPPNMPISVEDWTGAEIGRVYSDWWGDFDGLVYSTWEVNPPNPTGYAPNMMVFCMNDKASSSSAATDPLYNPAYSQFCYELPYMPGQTQYLDTPVVPTSAFSAGYNHPDCSYPDATPAVAEVDGDGKGPWVGGANGVGALGSITVTAGGSNYTSAPAVGFSSGNAKATSVISGMVTSISLSNGGAGYTGVPVVDLVGGGGSGATATAAGSGYVASATLTAGGSGYTSAPSVIIAGGGGSGATATASISGTVTGVTLTNGGKGYASAPSVTFNNAGTGGSGATATTTLATTGSVWSAAITNGGSGYTGTPTVVFTGGGGTGAVGTAVRNPLTRRILSVSITNGGSGYTSAPTISFTGGGGSGAAGTTTLAYSVASVQITNGGSGYNRAPSVTFGAPQLLGTRAAGTARETGSVVAVTIGSGGSGYTTPPTISFTGGGGTGTQATASLALKLTSVTLTAGGSGYSSAPRVQFVSADGAGSGAAATTTISGSVVAVVLNNPGSNYTTAPTVSFTGGNGSGAMATASVSGGTITITALGDQQVNNYAYSGPSATGTPYNAKTINRHYGFGGTQGTVTIGGKPATVVPGMWSDQSITVDAPTGIPACAIQQQAAYGGSTAECGQLVITAANGKQSIDAVTVTVGGKSPTYVSGNTPLSPSGTGSIQHAIDQAQPGDLIIVPQGTYYEMLLMWKPVRLQGVAAATVTIDGNTQPAGKMDPWRHQVNCLFGLALDGTPIGATNSANPNPAEYDPSGTFTCGGWPGFVGTANNPQVDRIPLEGIVGWDTTTNGNLAQLLQEPTLMGAYEGAGITVLAKGVNVPSTATTSYYGSGSEATFPTGTTNLTTANCSGLYPSSFWCNPSRIDGLSITDSSEGGGGIFAHGWTHYLEISNNRVYSNIGTLSGGINVGQGESPDAYLLGGDVADPPGSCETGAGLPTNSQLPYCFQNHMSVHNNYVTSNTSIGDELFSGTPAGAGGVSFCTGSDYYQFDYNWVCGNMSTGDGGGLAHIGFIKNGDIEHNSILFNQSLNPTIPTNGGGIIVMGAAPDGNQTVNGVSIECGSITDNDCAPGLSDGTGPGLVINANLIQGNAAEAGSGGGLRLQSVNGTDIPRFPGAPQDWYSVTVTNNVIVNNVAGWDGAGISLQDALVANIVNNTIASNDTTATAGPLTDTIGAPDASAPPAGSTTSSSGTTSLPQAAGLVTMGNSSVLTMALTTGALTCPANHGGNGTSASGNASGNNSCTATSIPYIANDLFWQNRAFYVGVGATLDAAHQNHLITLYNASGTPVSNQSKTGDCTDAASYWDIGARGDAGAGTHASGVTLAPTYSLLTNASESGSGTNNVTAANPNLVSQYCNGSRVPPEYAKGTFNVPPGIADATVPNPLFTLTANATVDEGNNWINLNWGPLSTLDVNGVNALGNYALQSGSPAIDKAPSLTSTYPPVAHDFFGNPRPDITGTAVDIGAIEYQGPAIAVLTVTPTSLTFSSTPDGGTSAAQTLTVTNSGNASATLNTITVSAGFVQSGGTCTNAYLLAGPGTCTILVEFKPTTQTGTVTGSVTISASVPVANSPVSLTGTVGSAGNLTLTPSPFAYRAQSRNCPGSGFGVIACGADQTQAFTLTNRGTTGVKVTNGGVLSGANTADFAIRPNLPLIGTKCSALPTLAPNASCVVTVQFQPQTSESTGNKTVTLTITEGTNSQSASISGQAN